MQKIIRTMAAALLLCCAAGSAAFAQKQGGILHIWHRDSPASMSPYDEGTIGVLMPMMQVFNNLVIYDQHIPQNRPDTIRPELATAWQWNNDFTALTFTLRPGVRWHDGKPFSAADVKCSMDLLTNKAPERLRLNARGSWWVNVADTTTNGELEVTIHLKRPQPALLGLLAAGGSPMYPCHVPPHEMRQHPIGTGPFRFVDYKPNQGIRLTRNPDYWKPNRPYLDGIEYTIVPNRSTALLAFATGKFDMTFPNEVTPPLLNDLHAQAPQAICEVAPSSEVVGLLVNRLAPPFDNADLRRAMALAIDRKALIEIVSQGEDRVGGAMQPPPEGAWGMPLEMLKDVPGYSGDMAANREEARAIMRRLGYGPDHRLPFKMTVRNLPGYRDPGTVLIDQFKEIYFDGELELTETAMWIPRLIRKDFRVAVSVLGNQADDPDVIFYQNHVCSSLRNYTGHCNPELDRKIDQQSMESDPLRRRQLVWEIDHTLQQELARPILYHIRSATCWQPAVKGLTLMVNSQYNGWRMEDVWLDR